MKKFLTGIFILLTSFSVNFCAFAADNTNNVVDSTVVSTDWGPYMRSLQRKIKMNWNPPETNTANGVILLFKLNRNGEVISSSILKSSGNSEVDKAAQKALKESSPFGKFPAEFKGQNIDIQFKFDYNVFATSIKNQKGEL